MQLVISRWISDKQTKTRGLNTQRGNETQEESADIMRQRGSKPQNTEHRTQDDQSKTGKDRKLKFVLCWLSNSNDYHCLSVSVSRISMQDVCAQSCWDHYVYFYLHLPKSLPSSVPDPQEPLLQAIVLRCVQAPEGAQRASETVSGVRKPQTVKLLCKMFYF